MSFVDWFMASFLYCFPYSYRNSNYCDSNRCSSFTLLKALAKCDGNLFAIAFKSEREPSKKSKELIPKRMQRGLRVLPLQGSIEKSPILLSQYWKNEWLDCTINILYFGGSNNIFADCMCWVCACLCVLQLFSIS